MYKHLKIPFKIFFGFTIIIIFILILSSVSLFNINKVGNLTYKMYNSSLTVVDKSLSIINDFNHLGRDIKSGLMDKNMSEYTDSINKSVADLEESLAIIEDKFLGDPSDIDIFKEAMQKAASIRKELLEKAETGNYEEAIKIESEEYTPAFEDALSKASKVYNFEKENAENFNNNASAIKTHSIILVSVILLIIVILSIMLSIIIAKSITKPLDEIIISSKKISHGDFNIELSTNRKDEVGILTNEIGNMAIIIKNLINDIKNIGNELKLGNINIKIDEKNYKGNYKEAAYEINNVVYEFVDDLKIISEGISNYTNGNFEFTSKKMPGDKAVFNKSLDKLKENLLLINSNINQFVVSAKNGDLNIKIDSSKFEGDWKNLVDNMNELVEVIALPIDNVSEPLNKISNGNLNAEINNIYKGKFGLMISNINEMTYFLKNIINEISEILEQMANQNLNVTVKNTYKGDFSNIKKALEMIIINFNSLLRGISYSAEQVATGSQQLAQTSSILADGASEQANSIQSLNITIEDISNQMNKNIENIKISDLSINATKESVEVGNKEMVNMLKAMEDINKASESISGIIKTIEDISFQTNILSLNAAVEAARAGEHGKGFSVVAEEVRNLASKSQKSAKETADLIENSILKVAIGIKTANTTANTLEKISEQISEIADISKIIEESNKEEELNISKMLKSIEQISEVINNNSSVSEECSAASEELANEAESFKNTVMKFSLN